MAINLVYTSTQPTPQSTCEQIQGTVVYDATAIVAADQTEIACGFAPDYVAWLNQTDLSMFEWYRGMADGTAIKTTAAGARSLIAAPNGISQPAGTRVFRVSQNAGTAAIAASKSCVYFARAN